MKLYQMNESIERTIEVLSDEDLMSQIKESRKKDVKVLDFEELVRELGI